VRPFLVFALICYCAVAHAQSTDNGKQVYASSQESVFLIYLNDPSGAPTALGSGFLISPRILITNAHVAEAGDPVLAVGPVRIPLKILKIDKKNDLAELAVTVDLTSKPLPISQESAKPGEQVYTIGNPEGLEKTISEGIVSGVRNQEGQDLIQITSPISHGSSGGPVLNGKGEVIGVAVGMLEDGQNLNFAVPVKYVQQLIEGKGAPTQAFNLQEALQQATEFSAARGKAVYSDEPTSEYQVALHGLLDTMRSISQNSADADALSEIACYGTQAFDLSDAGIEAARKLVKIKPIPEAQALLSYLLYDRAEDESFAVAMAKDGSEDQSKAKAAHEKYVSEAGEIALRATRSAKGNALTLADFVLGQAKAANGEDAEAIPFYTQVAQSNVNTCGTDIVMQALRSLVSSNAQAKRPAEAEKWFRTYAAKYQPTAWEWDQEGDRRNAANDPTGTASAYEGAATASTAYAYDYCYATRERYIQEPEASDAVLADGRACVEASTKNSDKGAAKHFDEELPYVYDFMAEVLKNRGVYETALQYTKEAINLKPDYPFAYDTEAEIFSKLAQYTECIVAAKNAVRTSDGKYPYMHFDLGSCYFSTQNWAMAANSFQIAAEGDKTDVASAFNLALSFENLERESDAQEWFREALRRNPDSDLKARIMKFLK